MLVMGFSRQNTEVVCHSLLQWTTFCQTSPPWPTHLGWPHRAWLSFIELDKAVDCVIRLAHFLWLWFQCVCPLKPSCNTCHLTWVSLTLDVVYLFTAAPAKCSHRSLPWTRSSLLIERGVAPLGPPAPAQDNGISVYLFSQMEHLEYSEVYKIWWCTHGKNCHKINPRGRINLLIS